MGVSNVYIVFTIFIIFLARHHIRSVSRVSFHIRPSIDLIKSVSKAVRIKDRKVCVNIYIYPPRPFNKVDSKREVENMTFLFAFPDTHTTGPSCFL